MTRVQVHHAVLVVTNTVVPAVAAADVTRTTYFGYVRCGGSIASVHAQAMQSGGKSAHVG